ncbi:MAG: hypothetical protein AB7U05_04080 [Mangrovibacterium sp.]
MEQRDYLLRQIQEMGLFLAKLMQRLHKRVEQDEEDQLLAEARDAFCVQFGWDLEELLFLDDRSFIGLMDDSLLADEHYETMASVFELLGDHALEHQTLLRKELYLHKALLLLTYVERKSQTFSLSRRDRIARLNVRLSD